MNLILDNFIEIETLKKNLILVSQPYTNFWLIINFHLFGIINGI